MKKLFVLILGLFFISLVSAWSVEITSPVQDAQYGNLIMNISYIISGVNESNLSSICWEDNVSSYCDYSSLQLTDTLDISSVEGDNLVVLNITLNNNESKLANVSFWVDSIFPNITINTPTEPDYFTTAVIPFYVEIDELNPKDVVYFSVRKLNASFPSWSWAPELNSGLNSFINSTNPMSSEGLYSFNVSVEDVMEHISQKSRWVYIDMTPPYYSNPQNQSDNIYAPGKSYEFNIIWQDSTSGIENVSFILDGNDYNVSYLGGDNIYSVVVTDLSAGNHSYSWSAVDKAGNLNSTGNLNYTVLKATPVLNLYADSWNVSYKNQTNVSGTGCLSQLNCTLYRNDFIAVEPAVLGAGNYLYVYNTSGNQNYTSASVNKTLIVNPISPEAGMNILISSPIVYGNPANVSANETNEGDNGCSYTLYANGSNVNNPDNTVYGAGIINYIFNTTGCQNYTAGSVSGILEIKKAPRNVSLIINETSPIIYGTLINVSCAGDYLLRNGAIINNENNILLGAGVYNYTCVLNETGNENYTDAVNESIFVVNKSNSSIELYLNNSLNNITVEQGSNESNVSINATRLTGEENLTVYIDNFLSYTGSLNVYGYHLFLVGGLHNITAVYPESQNYTFSSKTLWVNVTDTTPPKINIYSPVFNTTYTDNNIELKVSSNEYIDTWMYSLGENGTNISFTPNTTIFLENGDYNLFVWANDSFGNENSTNVSFKVSKPSYSGSGGGGGSCSAKYNCTKWSKWSICENGIQKRVCLKVETVSCGDGATMSEIDNGQTQECSFSIVKASSGESFDNETFNKEEENQEQGKISGITGGVIGFAKSRKGILSVIIALTLFGIVGAMHYKRRKNK